MMLMLRILPRKHARSERVVLSPVSPVAVEGQALSWPHLGWGRYL